MKATSSSVRVNGSSASGGAAGPVCSVIIPTRNRCASLQQTLNHVLAQRVDRPFETVVVDNGSTDDTAAVTRECCVRQKTVRYVFEPTPGPAAARNAGVAASRAALIVFTDDDIRPDEAWLQTLVEAAAGHPDIDGFGGRILPSWPHPPPAWLTRRHWTGALALQDYGDHPVAIDADRPLSLATANLAIRRTAFDAIGGFRADFLFAEDTELLLRLWRDGRRCLYTPAAVVTADIDPERMTKAYHRRWHRRNGTWAARMRLEESLDASGRLRDPVPGPQLFNVPACLYRQWLLMSARWLTAAIRGQRSLAFEFEKQLWQQTTYIRTRAAEPASKPWITVMGDTISTATELLRRKLFRIHHARVPNDVARMNRERSANE
jgi:GT2 family glycosyltransferase